MCCSSNHHAPRLEVGASKVVFAPGNRVRCSGVRRASLARKRPMYLRTMPSLPLCNPPL